jgi:hypothetical protein
VLRGGRLLAHAATDKAIGLYLQSANNQSEYEAEPDRGPRVLAVRTNLTDKGMILYSGESFALTVEVDLPCETPHPCVSFQLVNEAGVPVIHCWSYDDIRQAVVARRLQFKFHIPRLDLNVGRYSVTLNSSEPPGGRIFDRLDGICGFSVEMFGRTTLSGWRSEACTYLPAFHCASEIIG